jgi:hypothetical protein
MAAYHAPPYALPTVGLGSSEAGYPPGHQLEHGDRDTGSGHRPPRGIGNARTLVAAIREEPLDEGETPGDTVVDHPRPVAILHNRGMHLYAQHQAEDVGDEVALALRDRLPASKPACRALARRSGRFGRRRSRRSGSRRGSPGLGSGGRAGVDHASTLSACGRVSNTKRSRPAAPVRMLLPSYPNGAAEDDEVRVGPAHLELVSGRGSRSKRDTPGVFQPWLQSTAHAGSEPAKRVACLRVVHPE